MACSKNTHLRLYCLEHFLLQESDENHGYTAAQIEEYLDEKGISLDRKTLYKDLEYLRSQGMEIIKEQVGRQTFYKFVGRPMQMAELKLLAGFVETSMCITERKSKEMIAKLETLCSKYQAEELNQHIYISGRPKTPNESIFYNVDAIHSAINAGKQIIFTYLEWTLNKVQVARRGGKRYQISPWHLCMDNERYYMIGYDAEAGKVKFFCVDLMKNISESEKDREGQEHFQNFNPVEFARELFGMFGGITEKVTLLCDLSKVGTIIDRFGKDVKIERRGESEFTVTVDVALSQQFYGWVFGYGGTIKIVAPQKAVEDMGELAKQFLVPEKSE